MTTLLKNAWIYTPQGVIEGGYVVIDEAAIVSVGAERPEGRFDCEKDMSGKLLLPGLVNAHTHAAPKSASPREYAMATGLECLFGALYLLGENDRINELFNLGMEALYGI